MLLVFIQGVTRRARRVLGTTFAFFSVDVASFDASARHYPDILSNVCFYSLAGHFARLLHGVSHQEHS